MAGCLVGIGKAVDVAERSPAVISANLKEDMLLRKKVIILDRSERSVIHQIKVDQKVLYKRFQSRLVRSRLGFARIMGQKDVEKELRAKTIGGLNTDIAGNSEEDYDFLGKLENRPCAASSFSPRIPKPRKASMNPTESISNKATSSVKPSGRSLSARGRSDSNKNESSRGVNEKDSQHDQNNATQNSSMRPATTIGTRVDNEFLRHQKNRLAVKSKTNFNANKRTAGQKLKSAINKIANDVEVVLEESVDANEEFDSSRRSITQSEADTSITQSDNKTNENENASTTGEQETDEEKQGVSFLEELDLSYLRPRTVAMMTMSKSDSPPLSPNQFSRRTSRAADFFQEEKKIDLIDLRLREARSVNYTEMVEKFCSDLDEMKSAQNMPNVDYYAIRQEDSVKKRLSTKANYRVPGTPDDENKRAMGNIYIRSLTVPELDWNFTKLRI